MLKETFTFDGKGGLKIFTYKWRPEQDRKIKAVVQIAHGMAERAERYEALAKVLTDEGYIVYANDHRGHGYSSKDIDSIGDLGEDGFNLMIEDMHELTKIIKKENKALPLFLFGHSMGSFLSQRYICIYGQELKGVILSGSCGDQGFIVDLGKFIAKREIQKVGRSGKSNKLNSMSFGGYNKAFKPNRTEFDWLSSDDNEVDKYIKDPYCGGVFTAGFFLDFFNGLKSIWRKGEVDRIPKELPIYIFSGEKDPVGKMGKGVIKLVKGYKTAGIVDVTHKLYEGGRHEMLNEKNKDEVIDNIIKWLNYHM